MKGFIALVALFSTAAAAVQHPFQLAKDYDSASIKSFSDDIASSVKSPGRIHNSEFNFTTLQLSSLQNEREFTTLGHPRFPEYAVRIKKSSFCDPTVKYVPPYG